MNEYHKAKSIEQQNDVNEAHETALESEKMGQRIARQALKMVERGQLDAPRRENPIEWAKRNTLAYGRVTKDDLKSSELAANASLRDGDHDIKVELRAERDADDGFRDYVGIAPNYPQDK